MRDPYPRKVHVLSEYQVDARSKNLLFSIKTVQMRSDYVILYYTGYDSVQFIDPKNEN